MAVKIYSESEFFMLHAEKLDMSGADFNLSIVVTLYNCTLIRQDMNNVESELSPMPTTKKPYQLSDLF